MSYILVNIDSDMDKNIVAGELIAALSVLGYNYGQVPIGTNGVALTKQFAPDTATMMDTELSSNEPAPPEIATDTPSLEIQIASAEPMTAPAYEEPALPLLSPQAANEEPKQTGTIYLKGLSTTTPIPFEVDVHKDHSVLKVASVQSQDDIVIFTFNNMVFKFPVEKDASTIANIKTSLTSTSIRTVIQVSGAKSSWTAILSVEQSSDGQESVVIGNDLAMYCGAM